MELKTIDIKGKAYVTVNERIKAFRELFPKYKLISRIIQFDEKRVVMAAEVINQEGVIVANGHAYEDCNSSYINKTSYLENCETSAWGRALANLGIGIDNDIHSADELKNAMEAQEELPRPITQQEIQNLKAVFAGQPDNGKILKTLLMSDKEYEDLTNIEYAKIILKINEMESEGVKNIKKYVAAYTKSKGIKNSGDAAKEIETVLGIKLLAKPLEWKDLCRKIQELAEK